MTVKLSIIVPVYGVEKYLDIFFKSLTPNLIKGVEVILVDDGSKDNCGLIIDNYQREHAEYVKVFHKKNGGVSTARNAGLRLAKGEYIAWADPDDYISSNYTQTIIKSLLQFEKPDMLFFDYYECYSKVKKLVRTADYNSGLVEKTFFLKKYFSGKFNVDQLWHKVIKREILKDILFDETVRCGEDVLFFSEVVFKLNKIAYLSLPLYYYCDRDESLTKIEKVEHKKFVFEALKKAYFECQNNYNINPIGEVACRVYNSLRSEYVISNNMDENNVKEYEKFIKSNIQNIVFNSDIPITVKRHCLFVWLGVAKWYNQRKYKR